MDGLKIEDGWGITRYQKSGNLEIKNLWIWISTGIVMIGKIILIVSMAHAVVPDIIRH